VSGQAAAEAIEADLGAGAYAHRYFEQATAKLRSDLAISTSAARWFYANLDQGCRLLSLPLLRAAALNAFANGHNVAQLAVHARKLMRVAHAS
jgi:hypothetical protein